MSTQTVPTANGSVQKVKSDNLQVLVTTNYGLFTIMPENRNINLLHVKRLVESFKEQHLMSPLIVNEKYQVIDGQHRLMASMETGLPVYYIKVPGYGLGEVQRFNTNQKNWKNIDYLHSFCSEGRKPYLQFKEFMDDFPDFTIMSVERIIALRPSKKQNADKTAKNDFREGRLVIENLPRSYTLAKKIMEFKPFLKEFHTPTFVTAIMPLILKSKVYDHKEMIHKLSATKVYLTSQKDVESYRMNLEEVYNFKRQKENKVSFRYE
ncbi:MAG: ParB N-terminal domain-containing protein [Chitinophagaceae bacterium]|nr:ParB N-terminal domain-containing protein [Chitinophagaceae bacterium]